MTFKSSVPADYRGRDKMTLVEFIEDVESVNFRTRHDTGGNRNAMMVWNILRNYAGLDSITHDDLDQRHAEMDGRDLAELKAELDEYDARRRDDRLRRFTVKN